MAETEVTLVIVKPDGLKKSLTGNILTKLAEARFMIVGAKVVRVSRELAEAHYQHLKEKPFFNDLIEYIQGKPYGPEFERVMALVYKGPNAIKKVREIAGATLPAREPAHRILKAGGQAEPAHKLDGIAALLMALPAEKPLALSMKAIIAATLRTRPGRFARGELLQLSVSAGQISKINRAFQCLGVYRCQHDRPLIFTVGQYCRSLSPLKGCDSVRQYFGDILS